MALKTYKPTTPSQRHLVLVDRSHLWKGKPVKALTEGLTKSGGRNNHGRVTMWHRGGGHKRTYRKVDFKRGKLGVPAHVMHWPSRCRSAAASLAVISVRSRSRISDSSAVMASIRPIA